MGDARVFHKWENRISKGSASFLTEQRVFQGAVVFKEANPFSKWAPVSFPREKPVFLRGQTVLKGASQFSKG
jgi:hypothetical protein